MSKNKTVKEIYISTSDRKTLATCFRKFDLSSFLRQSYAPKNQAIPLWFGNMFHFVLEDYYGYKYYKNHKAAIKDYTQATKKFYKLKNIPHNYVELGELCLRMVNYYIDDWCETFKDRDYETVWVDGKPLVEIGFKIRLKIPKNLEKRLCQYYNVNKVKVYYKGIVDRVVKDKDDFIYILDYKSCKQFTSLTNIVIDKQVGAYLWAMPQIKELKGLNIFGFIYQQHKKDTPKLPAITAKTKKLSLSINQPTTAKLFKRSAKQEYGKLNKWPKAVMICYNTYKNKYPLGVNGDAWIQQEIVHRNKFSSKLEYKDFMNEVITMINPDTPIFRSASLNCTSMCSFKNVCLAMNSDEKLAHRMLTDDFFKQSLLDRSGWAKYLKKKPNKGKEDY